MFCVLLDTQKGIKAIANNKGFFITETKVPISMLMSTNLPNT